MPRGARYPRADRVRAAIKEVLADEVERLEDPGMGFLTITDVTLTRDLRHATAYYTVYGEPGERAATRQALARAAGRLRGAIADQVRLKFVPTLELREDEVPERARRIDEVIRDLHEREGPGER